MEAHRGAFLNNCLWFTRMLRAAGVPVGVDRAQAFVQALELINLRSREQVYYAARGLLIGRREHLRLFDTLFARFWRASTFRRMRARQKAPLAPRQRKIPPFTVATYLAYKARMDDPAINLIDKSGTASDLELLQRKDFAELAPEELEQVRRLIAELHWRISLRTTRRRMRARRGGSLHLRAVLRESARHGGVPLRLAWQRRKQRQRPLVLIADISGSMETYARLLLQFLFSAVHGTQRAECFVFGTRLTRITPQLRLRNIDRAIDEASREVVDWAGGTRIGASLKEFNRRWSRRVLGRGAVVLVISDGWDQGDPALLAGELRFIQHRCHRLIWLNPLAGREGYRPLVGGMRAALTYIDDFVPIHNFQSLAALAARIGDLEQRRYLRT
jgi:uncharacterized protein with von Willebrand factor type A (vWA) domain